MSRQRIHAAAFGFGLFCGILLYNGVSSAWNVHGMPEYNYSDSVDTGIPSMLHSQFQPPPPTLLKRLAKLQAMYVSCRGKSEYLRFLLGARDRRIRQEMSSIICDRLPTTTKVADLYGPEPIVYGLETCQAYRNKLQALNQTPQPRIAGLYNTGTNALAQLLQYNLQRVALTNMVQGYEAPVRGE